MSSSEGVTAYTAAAAGKVSVRVEWREKYGSANEAT